MEQGDTKIDLPRNRRYATLIRYLLTGFLAVIGIITLLGALAAISSLPSAYAEFDREPEDFYLLIFWSFICLFIGSYCTSGFIAGIVNRAFVPGLLGHTSSIIVFLMGSGILVVAASSSLDRFLVYPAILVLLCPVAYLGLRKVCGTVSRT